MSLTGNIAYGIAGLTGVSAAVGVPIGLRNSGITRNYGLNTFSLTACEPNKRDDLSEITYGDKSSKNTCGDGTDNQSNVSNNHSSEFTELFQDSGEGKGNFWSGREGRGGTGQCLKGQRDDVNLQSQGTINVKSDQGDKKNSGSEEKVDYVGLCGDTIFEGTKFAKRQKKTVTSGEESSWTLGTCSNDCGEEIKTLEEVKELTKEKESGGKQVKFYGESEKSNIESSN